MIFDALIETRPYEVTFYLDNVRQSFFQRVFLLVHHVKVNLPDKPFQSCFQECN